MRTSGAQALARARERCHHLAIVSIIFIAGPAPATSNHFCLFVLTALCVRAMIAGFLPIPQEACQGLRLAARIRGYLSGFRLSPSFGHIAGISTTQVSRCAATTLHHSHCTFTNILLYTPDAVTYLEQSGP